MSVAQLSQKRACPHGTSANPSRGATRQTSQQSAGSSGAAAAGSSAVEVIAVDAVDRSSASSSASNLDRHALMRDSLTMLDLRFGWRMFSVYEVSSACQHLAGLEKLGF